MAEKYIPSNPPNVLNLEGRNLRVFTHWLRTELENISRAHNNTIDIQLDPQGAVPTKIKNGMIRYADGTNWNPGSGTGAYVRVEGVWRRFDL